MTSRFHRAIALILLVAPASMSRAQNTPALAPAPPLGPRPVAPALIPGDARPAGATIHIRLRETVSSFGREAEMPISALVIQLVMLNHEIAIPLSMQLGGTSSTSGALGSPSPAKPPQSSPPASTALHYRHRHLLLRLP